MGKHQWLENGNLLITESMRGRAFEINQNKEIVWDFRNLIGRNRTGLVTEVSKINPDKIKPFFSKKTE